LPLVRQVLQAQEYWRLKGLSADVVILNEHPVSYLDEMHAQLTALLDNGPWRTWKHRPGGAYLLRGDRMTEAERILLAAVARAVLSGERGELANQLDQLAPEWPEPEEFTPSLEPRSPPPSSAEVTRPPPSPANGMGGVAGAPTPGTMPRTGADGRFVIRHSAGLTRFARVARGLRHELDVFVDAKDPVKFSLLTLTNEGARARRLSVFAYNEWVLGPPRA